MLDILREFVGRPLGDDVYVSLNSKKDTDYRCAAALKDVADALRVVVPSLMFHRWLCPR